jgi:8'-apo-carotenoid 13,14-cleaving dioxygenase
MNANLKSQETIDAPANPFLSGVHTPMKNELTLEDLPVKGRIPEVFNGRYLRLGPNPMNPDPANYHWFSGDGMVHGFRIEGGRALWYRNRWIRSETITNALGEPRTPGPRHTFEIVNTNVFGFGGKTLGVVEAGSTPVELGDLLNTLRYTDFEGTLHGSFAAHPHVDPRTGEMLGVCYDVANQSSIRYVAVTPEGKVRREVEIPIEHGPMIHDCAFTQRFAIILDLPVTFSRDMAESGHPFPYGWNEAHAARVGLLPREGEADDIIWCATDPCYIFHAINSFDAADGTVILDVAVHDRMFFRSKAGPDSQRSGLERWTIDPVTRAVQRFALDPTPQEFPRPDERRLGMPYRYAYTMEMVGAFLGARLFKQDFVNGTREAHDFGPDCHPCEFVFVPAHAEAEEDEGWVMGLVIDAKARTTDLVILDSRNFAGPPQASIRVPHIVPPGFHGNWVPAV